MSQVLAILWAKGRIGRHQLASIRNESVLKVSVISVCATLLWVGAFVLFMAGFEFLLDIGGRGSGEFNFGTLIMSRLLNILGLSVFFLLIFSNVLVCFSTMYRSKEVVYLLQGPITFEQFFYARFVECVSFSSWSLAYLGTPLILAYGLKTEASPAFYVATILFYVPFVTLPACLGCALTIVLARIFPRMSTRSMVAAGVAAVASFGLYIAHIIRNTRIDEDEVLPAFLNASQRAQSPFLPSTWAADGVLAAARYDFGEAGFFFLLTLSSALMALLATGWLASWMFYPGWSYLMGQDKQRIRKGGGPLGWVERALQVTPNPFRTLSIKDVKLFWRDPTQWSQFVIFFGIMGIYIANLRNTSQSFEREVWRAWVACLNVGAVSLILATLTSRFVFPLVSLEGKRFWILGLAPLTYSQLVWQKFWLSVACTSVFTVALAALSGYMLDLAPIYYFLTVYSVVATNFGLSGLAVGLGTLYPNFQEDNPARIVSGMGGTLNLLLSVGYITLVVAAQCLVLQWNLLEMFSSPGLFPVAMGGALVVITGLSLLCTFVPMRLGLRNLESMEF